MPDMLEIPSSAWLDGAAFSMKEQVRQQGSIRVAGKLYTVDALQYRVECAKKDDGGQPLLSALDKLFPRQDSNSRRLSTILFPVVPGTQAARNAAGRLHRFLHCEHGQALTARVGADASKRVLSSLLLSRMPGEGPGRTLYDVDLDVIAILQAEQGRARRARAHMDGLRGVDLSRGIYAERLAPPPSGADPIQRAAAWILGASHSHDTAVEALHKALRSGRGADLLSIDVLDALHRQLAPEAAALPARPPGLDGRHYPCQEIGRALLCDFLRELRRSPPPPGQLPALLLGATLGFHGYADGNGRLARTLYSLAQMRVGEFHAPTVAAENALSGLNG